MGFPDVYWSDELVQPVKYPSVKASEQSPRHSSFISWIRPGIRIRPLSTFFNWPGLEPGYGVDTTILLHTVRGFEGRRPVPATAPRSRDRLRLRNGLACRQRRASRKTRISFTASGLFVQQKWSIRVAAVTRNRPPFQ